MYFRIPKPLLSRVYGYITSLLLAVYCIQDHSGPDLRVPGHTTHCIVNTIPFAIFVVRLATTVTQVVECDLGNVEQEKIERGVLFEIYTCADLNLSMLL